MNNLIIEKLKRLSQIINLPENGEVKVDIN